MEYKVSHPRGIFFHLMGNYDIFSRGLASIFFVTYNYYPGIFSLHKPVSLYFSMKLLFLTHKWFGKQRHRIERRERITGTHFHSLGLERRKIICILTRTQVLDK